MVEERPQARVSRTPHGRLLSARDAEKVLGIPAATVRSWWHRRRRNGLYDYGRDKRNNPMFREQDLLALWDGRRLRTERRHTGGAST